MSSNEEFVLKIQQGENVKDALFENIYKLLYFFCRSYKAHAEMLGYEIEDLISVSWLGVEKAIESYQPEKGAKFTVYLKYHIKTALSRFFYPKGKKEDITILSLDAPLKNQDSEKITLADTLSDEAAAEEFDEAENCDYYDLLISEINRLAPEEIEIIKRHYFESETLTHIAKEKNVSTENIAAKKREALWTLRRSRKLKECYYSDYAYRHISLNEFKHSRTSSTEYAVLQLNAQ